MKAILLAAGRGSRLNALTAHKPKCLTDLDGIPLLRWLLTSLKLAGLKECYLVTGYKAEQLRVFGTTQIHNARWQETNMVESLRCASSILNQEEVLVSYTDILFSPETAMELIKSTDFISLCYDPKWTELWTQRFANPCDDAERFRLDVYSCVIEIGGRLASISQAEGQYMGLLKMTPQAWKYISGLLDAMPQKDVDKLDMTALLSLLGYQTPLRIKAIPVVGRWCEVDCASDVSIAESLVRNAFRPRGDFMKALQSTHT